ncbi:adenine-specific methyltransferase EcoRI family protein [uncultured Brachybacterium sp.]|uniref:adenine-specific methyltransferase EcoRI family protein n=1 Tax=uncultured Brachybacterium sp. TaxID=189680 RepID=UPI00262D756F|nr:adenine-specific methyltransferase EcoRI family protein [uncultured Brachybacterium sp.]
MTADTRSVIRHLNAAKGAKQDEFYTELSDIEKELRHYRRHFKGKVVYLNCDDPRESQFFHYFSYNFEKLGLKKLIAACYKSQDVDAFSRGDTSKAVYLEYEGDKDGDRLPGRDEIEVKHFQGNGDFRSEESIALLKESDIVVTNPPFSLFREYVAQLMQYEKQFLIVGNQGAITYKEVFPLIAGSKMWLGVNNGDMKFRVPKHYESRATRYWVDEQGQAWRSLGNACWFTNLDINKRHEDLILYRRYTPEAYPAYDNYDAIEVSRTSEIPEDYLGVMGVPVTFLDKHNRDQFDILGTTQRGCHEAVPDTKKYDDYREMRSDGTPTGASGGKTNENANLQGNDGKKNYFINSDGHIVQATYKRIFIRRKGAV